MPQSLRKRYVAKLLANIIGSTIAVAIAAIVPRALGPQSYGDFNFLSNFFLSLIGFVTLSTSNGFYVKLSQRLNENSLISFYTIFTLAACIVLFLIILICQLLGLSNLIWIDQSINMIYFAALYTALNWILQILTYVVDAYGFTVSTEIIRIFQKVISLIIVFILFSFNKLNLEIYFIFNYFMIFLLIISFIWVVRRNGIHILAKTNLNFSLAKTYLKEFLEYSSPLFFFSLILFVFGILDRWLLQKYGGSIQQGFFGLSYQIAAVCFLFTSAMTPLIMREFSIAYAENNNQEISRLFKRYVPLLYSITAYFACFASIQSDKISFIFGGSEFKNAAIPVMIMALTPIHQTYGQLSSSIFFATGDTKTYSRINIFFTIIGLPVVYFLLLPKSSFGLNAGATGLAIKIFLFQFIGVNVQLYYNVKFMKLKFGQFFAHQIYSIAFFILVALFSKFLLSNLLPMTHLVIADFLLSGIVYSIVVGIGIVCFPVISGLQREDIKVCINWFNKNVLRRKILG